MAVLITALVPMGHLVFLNPPAAYSSSHESWYLDCASTKVIEGGSVTAYIRRQPGQTGGFFWAYWWTKSETASDNDYDAISRADRVRQDATVSDQNDNAISRLFHSTDDYRVEHNETYSIITDEANIWDLDDPEKDNKCRITIEDDDRFTGDIVTTTDGTQVTITLNEPLSTHRLLRWATSKFNIPVSLVYRAVFDVKVDNRWYVPTDATLSGNVITLTMPQPITQGQAVKVRYENIFAEDSEGLFLNDAGIIFPNFRASPAINNSTVADAQGGPGPWIPISKEQITMDEGGNFTYNVKLSRRPTGTVTVSVSNYPTGTRSSYTSLSTNKDTLTFDRSNWSTWQEVKLKAHEDNDGVNFWSLVSHQASGGGYDVKKDIHVLVEDNDLFNISGEGVLDVASPWDGKLIYLNGNETKNYQVKLRRKITGNITVSLTPGQGLTVNPTSLTFKPGNWDQNQRVRITATNTSNRITEVDHVPSGNGFDENASFSLGVVVFPD